jgi:hypothetical protein
MGGCERCVLALECFTMLSSGMRYLEEKQINHMLTALKSITRDPINSCDDGTKCGRLEYIETRRGYTLFDRYNNVFRCHHIIITKMIIDVSNFDMIIIYIYIYVQLDVTYCNYFI